MNRYQVRGFILLRASWNLEATDEIEAKNMARTLSPDFIDYNSAQVLPESFKSNPIVKYEITLPMDNDDFTGPAETFQKEFESVGSSNGHHKSYHSIRTYKPEDDF
tara:strand:+ start:935 stop:1252 length:318 start_codon:yes stop_codon:yes gene_type:complete